jgi:predicted nucleotidyltransferase
MLRIFPCRAQKNVNIPLKRYEKYIFIFLEIILKLNKKSNKIGLDFIKKMCHYIIMDTNIPYMDKIISIIVSLASPDQIILFGSYARGDNTKKSDIDLLIVKKSLKKGREISGLIYKAFLENEIGVPVDLLTIDYNRYIELNNEIGYIYKTIKEEGKIIYGSL